MIENWLRHAELTAKAKGLIPALALWGLAAAIASLAALIFLSIAGYIWLSQRYDGLIAALILTGVYILLAIVCVIVLMLIRQRTIRRARAELAARARAPSLWQDPRVLAAGLEFGRMVGWKKTVPLAAIGLFVAGITREWSNSRHASQDKN